MNITVKTLHIDITPAIKEYAHKKMEKLQKFFDNTQEIIVELDYYHNAQESQRHFAAGIIHASQGTIHAEDRASDLYAAIDALYEKLSQQLKKHKEKMRDHTRRGTTKLGILLGGAIEEDHHETPKKEKPSYLYVPKPMDPEEAVTLLEERETPFIMFRNLKTEQINVVYPLSDGGFGLIEP
jgi:putative sigma-54 modulation protein